MNRKQQQYEYFRLTAAESRIRLLKSETQAREQISERRTKVQANIQKNLEEAELKTLNDLKATVIEQEARIANTEEQISNLIQRGDDAAFEKTVHAFADVVVRFEGNDTFEQLHQPLLSLGSVHLEDVITAQMTASGMSSACYKEDNIYHEISSLRECDRNLSAGEDDTYDSYYENTNEISALNQHEHVYEFESSQFMSAQSWRSGNDRDIAENDSHEYRNVENENEVEDEVSTGNAQSQCKHLPVYSNTQQQTSENNDACKLYCAPSDILRQTLANVDGSDSEITGSASIEQQSQTGDNENAYPDSSDTENITITKVDYRCENMTSDYPKVRKKIDVNFDGDKDAAAVPTTSSNLINIYEDNCDYTPSNPSTTEKHSRFNRDNGEGTPEYTSAIRKQLHYLDMGNGKNTAANSFPSIKEPVYATSHPQRKTSIQSHHLFGGESMSLESTSNGSKQDLVVLYSRNKTDSIYTDCKSMGEHEHVTVRTTKWNTFHSDGMHILCDASKDSGRLAIKSDGRIVLLCEAENTLTLFDQHFKPVKTQTITSPKGICIGKDDLVAIVQNDGYNENVLLVEAKANYLKIIECKVLEYEERTVEIKYRDNRYYLGCCTFKVYIYNEDFEKIWLINCGELRCPMISFDYNHVTGTLYTVNSNGILNSVKDIHKGVETDYFKMQGIAVCCHGEKTYILCEQQIYKVVEMYQDQEKGFQQRPVIIISAGAIPIDICLSSDGSVLMILHLKETFVSVETYSVKTQFLTHSTEDK